MDTKGIIDIDKTNNRLVINPIGDLFRDPIHQIDMAVCKDPTCNCGSCDMILKTRTLQNEKQIEFKIPINVLNETIDHSSGDDFYFRDQDKSYVVHLLSDSLSKSDWKKLKGLYLDHKVQFIEEVNPYEVDFQFKEKDLMDKSRQFPYYDIFPSSFFMAKLDGINYFMFDSYCKNPSCKCSDVFISILPVNEATLGKTFYMGGFWYDYKTGKTKLEGEKKTLVKQLFTTIKKQEHNFEKTLERRSKNMKIIYKKSYKKYAHLYNKPKPSLQVKKIGRNELCACGSGKKYKKCCMNK